MSIDYKAMTVAEFEAFVNLPENSERRFELIEGSIAPVPNNPLSSQIAVQIAFLIKLFLREAGLRLYVTGEGGGYMVNGQVFAPDVALTTEVADSGFGEVPPLLAVEVISDPASGSEQKTLRHKVSHYLKAGTTVWIVDHRARTVEVHHPDESVRLLGEDDTITIAAILPGFALHVREIFEA